MMRATKSKTELRSAEKNQRDKIFWQGLHKEQEERAAKTKRLRALRLAKEASEREEAEKLAVEEAAAKPKSPTKKVRLVKRRSTAEGVVATTRNDPTGL